MTILLLRTILLHLIETVKFSDKLSTMIFHVSRFLDTSKMFMPQRLNDCLGMGMGRNGNGAYENGREWECKNSFPIISSCAVTIRQLLCPARCMYVRMYLFSSTNTTHKTSCQKDSKAQRRLQLPATKMSIRGR